jgi:tRNA/tmRNA/rRNA uracil-C5-methylase (TrmA/RlmC/RlmD family)
MIKQNISGHTVLDAYCGCGIIGLYVHDAADTIVGIDSSSESIAYARKNADLNKILHVKFEEADVESLLDKMNHTYDTVIVDPPRSGLSTKVIQTLNRRLPGKIIYMSCNPRSQVKDVRRLKNYRILEICGFDMFPQTNHVETVAVLERRG